MDQYLALSNFINVILLSILWQFNSRYLWIPSNKAVAINLMSNK